MCVISLKAVDEGKYVHQFYYGHIQLSKKLTVLVLDRQDMHTSTHTRTHTHTHRHTHTHTHTDLLRSVMLIEKQVLRDVLGNGGWHS